MRERLQGAGFTDSRAGVSGGLTLIVNYALIKCKRKNASSAGWAGLVEGKYSGVGDYRAILMVLALPLVSRAVTMTKPRGAFSSESVAVVPSAVAEAIRAPLML